MIADADHIVDLIPIIIGVQAIAGQGALGILQLADAAGEMETIYCVGQVALAYHINGIVVDHHGDIHIHIQLVGARFQLFAYLFPLPAIPIGHMGEDGVIRLQVAQFRQFILGAAIAADELCTLTFGLAFRVAVGHL